MRRQCLPIEQLQAWSHLNSVQLFATAIAGSVKDGPIDKGAGLVATSRISENKSGHTRILSVPPDLILSKERVEEAAKSDKHLQDVLTAVGDFAQKPRAAILIFLLLQATHASPDIVGENVGVTSPLTDYVKFLPGQILLPTFYSLEEQELLIGTSMKDALDQKMISLESEFYRLRHATQEIAWCQRLWWDAETGHLTFEDWKELDAIYRSRALDLPGIGDAMVPLVDMANHALDQYYNARFEIDRDGSALLVLRDMKSVEKEEEITIMYGAGGACEMVFSYGFLDSEAAYAREMFLDLDIPADDPLRLAKITMAKAAPGVRLYTNQSGSMAWESKYVWWACVNEEDGLEFQVLQRTDGARELTATWKDTELEARDLESFLLSDEMADVFRLRATVLIQQRLEQQGTALQRTDGLYEGAIGQPSVRDEVWDTIGRLRSLELELLSSAFEILEDQVCPNTFLSLHGVCLQGANLAKKLHLMESGIVQKYLGGTGASQPAGRKEDDFS